MGRAMLAAVFAVVMTVLTLLPSGGSAGTPSAGSGSSPSAPPSTPAAPEPTEPTAPTAPTGPAEEPTVTDSASATATPTPADCTPDVPLVDPEATPEARCLARTLDDWRAAGRYGLGQQLNVSSAAYLDPLDQVAPRQPSVVGFDLDELAEGELYGFPEPPLRTLLDLAANGVVLTASWHMRNPATGGDSYDKGWQDLGALLDPARSDPVSRRAYRTFWADVDAKLALLARFQSGDSGAAQPAAVVFRPFHEANGDWFWWAQGADPTAYRQLYAAVQQRAADAGVHNVVWGWSANARNDDRITDPLSLLPDRVDVAGVDSYEQMAGRGEQDQQLDLAGLAELAGRVPRAAVTEAGPHGSTDGRWDPAVIASSATAVGVRPAYVMLWFDDGDGADGYTGKKQLGSLDGGLGLLASCPDGVCPLP